MGHIEDRFWVLVVRLAAILAVALPCGVALLLLWVVAKVFLDGAAITQGAPLERLAIVSLTIACCAALAGGCLGSGCAIAARRLAPPLGRAFIVAAVDMLRSMPAVVFGWLAVTLILPAAGSRLGAAASYATAAIVLAFMTAPPAYTATARALARIPNRVREAALAVGASPLQAIALIIMPMLRRPIAGAFIAAFGAAATEATALQVIFAAALRTTPAGGLTIASWTLSQGTFGRPSAPPFALPALAPLAVSALILLVVAALASAVAARMQSGVRRDAFGRPIA